MREGKAGGVTGGMTRRQASQGRGGSLLTASPDNLSPTDRFIRNYYLDVGLNPDNPNESLKAPEGLGISFGRNTNRMLDNPFGGGSGTRILTIPEMNDAVTGSTGTGGILDDPNAERNQPYALNVGNFRPMGRTPDMIAADKERRSKLRTATYGYDPLADPTSQAEQLKEATFKAKRRDQVALAGKVERVRRTVTDFGNVLDGSPSSGGTISREGMTRTVGADGTIDDVYPKVPALSDRVAPMPRPERTVVPIEDVPAGPDPLRGGGPDIGAPVMAVAPTRSRGSVSVFDRLAAPMAKAMDYELKPVDAAVDFVKRGMNWARTSPQLAQERAAYRKVRGALGGF